MCPAGQCPLSAGMVSGPYLPCPLHDEKINPDTGSVEAPGTGQVKTVEVLVNEEHVFCGHLKKHARLITGRAFGFSAIIMT
ncbi:hypothetical protein L2D08_10575 [Domibacillus sp. PGB-M46]|nr:hypothetical protein [Domibacillus sp. PGB-M46]